MKVLGISGSPRSDHTVDKLVKAVLSGVECEAEFVSLANKKIRPCIACMGCVSDNICKVWDDMSSLREKICEADAYVIGAPNYFSTLNGLTHCFLERFYQFRHRGGRDVAGKLGVAVGAGGGQPDAPLQSIQRFFEYNGIETVGTVCAQGAAPCFACGHGETCRAGAIHIFYGPETKITDDMIPCLEKQPDTIAAAKQLGRQLSDRIRKKVTAT